jgi:hypothetical protein
MADPFGEYPCNVCGEPGILKDCGIPLCDKHAEHCKCIPSDPMLDCTNAAVCDDDDDKRPNTQNVEIDKTPGARDWSVHIMHKWAPEEYVNHTYTSAPSLMVAIADAAYWCGCNKTRLLSVAVWGVQYPKAKIERAIRAYCTGHTSYQLTTSLHAIR